MKTSCVVTQGKIHLGADFQAFLKELPDNTILEIDWNIKGKQRSNSQNAKYWKLIDLASEVSGYTKDELHDICRYKFLGTTTFNIAGEDVVSINHTPDTTSKEFTDYIMKVEHFLISYFNLEL